MDRAAVVRLSMAASGVMLAYQVASKAVRDAVFLSAWSAAALPAVVIAAAALAVALVPLFARLLARFGPAAVVPVGFLLSAAGHLVEWRLSSANPWVAAAVYLHTAGVGALLLSGVWSFVSELFDPRSAKTSYVRIAAAGTFGGLAGGVAAERVATLLSVNDALPMLAAAHVICAALTFTLGITSRPTAARTETGAVLQPESLRAAPYLKTVAAFVVIGTATAAMLDFLLKARAAQAMPSAPELLHFFAVFYTVTQGVTFLAQLGVTKFVARMGVGGSTGSLPAGVAVTAGAALLFPAFPLFIIARGAEQVLRGSLFRSGYELLFNPLAPEQKRRTKAFLDVACDRAGDAVGAGIVQALLIATPAFVTSALIAAVVALSLVGVWISKRLDAMYVQVVGRRLIQAAGGPPTMMGTEPLWTVFDTSATGSRTPSPQAVRTASASAAPANQDRIVATLLTLRSGNIEPVRNALDRLDTPDTLHVAQIVQLLAWDEVLEPARRALERSAASHVGLLIDNLVNPDNDFAVRRRIPRVLSTVTSERAVSGLVCGLDDARFEVRYQCSHALDRLIRRSPHLTVDRDRIFAVVARELSVDPSVWHAYRLLDRPDTDPAIRAAARAGGEFLEHVFLLLATVLPRDEILVAMRGVDSADPLVRSLAFEYLESVLPAPIRDALWAMKDRINN
jgi:AAA family ATP:ADP antiporter